VLKGEARATGDDRRRHMHRWGTAPTHVEVGSSLKGGGVGGALTMM
jgi:hypothetical protein